MTTTEQHRPCPRCGGENRFYLVLKPRSGATPYWKCRKCDYWESEGKARMGSNPTKAEPMTPEIYAEAHGATWADFQKAGCTWVKHPWRGRTYDAIRFPEGEGGGRLRLFGCEDKWIPERKGQAPMLWGLTRAIRLAQRQGASALFFVNGHSSVIALQAAGIPAICIPGGEGNAAGYLRRGLLDELRAAWPGPIVVMLDGDTQGRKSAPDVVGVLRGAGATSWSVDPGDGMDAADALRLRGASAVLALAEQPTPAPELSPLSPHSRESESGESSGRWKLYTYEGLASLPPTQWLIDKRIVANGFNLIYGPSGSGKSFYTLGKCFEIAEQHPDRTVIYIAPEGGGGYHKRARAWSLHHRRPVPQNVVWLLDAPRLDDPMQHAELTALLLPLNPIVVVIDTLARCAIGLDENSARDMGILINATDQLRKSLNCASILVHHTGKSGTGYRGSSALLAAADVALELQPDGDLIKLESAKAKDDKAFEPETMTLRIIDEADSCVIVPASTRVDISAPLSKNERKILESLGMEIFTVAGAKSAQVQKITGLPDATVYRVLSALKKRGLVTQNDKGDPFFISEAGEDELSRQEAQQEAQLSQLSRTLTPTRETHDSSLLSLSPPYRGESDSSEMRVSERPPTQTEIERREWLRQARHAPPPSREREDADAAD